MRRERDDEREDRRWLWLALPASLVLHAIVALFAPDASSERMRREVARWADTTWIDAPVGEPGAFGSAPAEEVSAGAPLNASESRDGMRAESPRRAPAANLAAATTESDDVVATDGARGAEPIAAVATDERVAATGDEGEGAGGLSDDAFLDGLLTRGAGVGGGGGDGCTDPIVGTWHARRYDEEGVGVDVLVPPPASSFRVAVDDRRGGRLPRPRRTGRSLLQEVSKRDPRRGPRIPGTNLRAGVLGHHASFSIRITAHEGERLEGTITLRAWSGEASETSPPRCRPGHYDHSVQMNARGTLRGETFSLDALDHRRTEHCMDFGRWAYNLDHFRGRLAGERLDVVNNDGGREVNAPYRFRRVACR